ncbi:uncharacterized protein LOC108682808 [Hyalella azteca]|uniref:Uncharacterized protein LOC108682808 n=1 Tax=Hyalella azteca TaxID=294128 RepID=A0A8B7PQJ1_HYAAZ|nr:uncharacterized protein LOC108682808 [Hyalella azteca]
MLARVESREPCGDIASAETDGSLNVVHASEDLRKKLWASGGIHTIFADSLDFWPDLYGTSGISESSSRLYQPGDIKIELGTVFLLMLQLLIVTTDKAVISAVATAVVTAVTAVVPVGNAAAATAVVPVGNAAAATAVVPVGNAAAATAVVPVVNAAAATAVVPAVNAAAAATAVVPVVNAAAATSVVRSRLAIIELDIEAADSFIASLLGPPLNARLELNITELSSQAAEFDDNHLF